MDRNRSRIKRNLAKGKGIKGLTPTEQVMAAYGNKRLRHAAEIMAQVEKKRKGKN